MNDVFHGSQSAMEHLLPYAERAAALLKDRRETIVVAESSAGGLISAALLALPGASAYFLGGAIIYTRQSRGLFLNIADGALAGMRPASEPYALLLARTARSQFSATWGLSETGATGPAGNRYGDSPGHACIAVVGPSEQVMTVETGRNERTDNMRVFAQAALDLLIQALSGSKPHPVG
jgi:nicotinamide-nucleotide amidase